MAAYELQWRKAQQSRSVLVVILFVTLTLLGYDVVRADKSRNDVTLSDA